MHSANTAVPPNIPALDTVAEARTHAFSHPKIHWASMQHAAPSKFTSYVYSMGLLPAHHLPMR